ncbi:hypothetical protein [Tenacibaculum sp. 190524A05c]|uniref:Uncharacterized protein n=1 Tax=Tenacibaculum platacis TaxID=3137852 RepID=A0ABM9NT45_9FLAO
MIKKLPLVLILFCSCFGFSQEMIGEIEHSLKETSKKVRGSLTIVNHKNNDIATFISDQYNIYGYLTNAEFEPKNELTLPRNIKFSGIVGKTFTEETYTFIVSNKHLKSFDLIKFDFKKDTAYYKNDRFYSKGMTLLQTVNMGDKSHLLFLKQKTSELVVKTYFNDGNSTLKKFNIKNVKLFLNDTIETTLSKLLYNILYNDYTITKLHSLEYQTSELEKNKLQHIPIESATDFTKLYASENSIKIVLDKNKFYTQILSLDLKKESFSLQKVKKPFFEIPSTKKTTNSFLVNNLLFAAACTKDELKIDVHNLENDQLIKSYTISSNTSFPFSNYKLLLDGEKKSSQKSKKKFFRTLLFSDIGIFVEELSDGFTITVGGKKPATLDNPTMGVNMTDNAALYSVNNYRGFLDPHSYILNVYRNVESTFLTYAVDKELNITNSKVQENIYHKINRHIKKAKLNTNQSHLFRLNQKTIYSYYDRQNNSYKFLAF